MSQPNTSLTNAAVSWINGQPFNNVLLIGILASMIYGAYFAINDAIPVHLKQIQSGYETIDARNREQITELRTTFSATLDRYDRVWSDRVERAEREEKTTQPTASK